MADFGADLELDSALDVGRALHASGPEATARAICEQAEQMSGQTATPTQLREMANYQLNFWGRVAAELRVIADEREN